MDIKQRRLRILAPRVFDSISGIFHTNQAITVSRATGLIVDVRPFATYDPEAIPPTTKKQKYNPGTSLEDDVDVLDLTQRNMTIVPGFIDTHVHLFLYPFAKRSWNEQVTRETTAERTIRATVHAREALMAGFTTVRDVGTEGAEDADLALRKCVSGPNPMILGPRCFTANRAIVSTGSYGPKADVHPHEEGIDGKYGAVAVDGYADCVREVRRQIGTGADWVKIYADYRVRFRQANVGPRYAKQALQLFTSEEFKAMIDTAHSLGVKIAAHATRADTIQTLIELGIDSIEHGVYMDAETLMKLKATNGKTTWNPTLGAYKTNDDPNFAKLARNTFQEALRIGGIKIACGGDTGVFAHGANALELLLMVEYGAPWQEVLKWATIGGWECIRSMDWEGEKGARRLEDFARAAAADDERAAFEEIGESWPLGDNDVPLGAIRPGYAADIIGLDGDFLQDGESGFVAALGGMNIEIPQKAAFVMKAGRVYRMDGRESVVPML